MLASTGAWRVGWVRLSGFACVTERAECDSEVCRAVRHARRSRVFPGAGVRVRGPRYISHIVAALWPMPYRRTVQCVSLPGTHL